MLLKDSTSKITNPEYIFPKHLVNVPTNGYNNRKIIT